MDIAAKIRALLKRDKFNTQAKLARELGVTQPTVARWLTGSAPTGDIRDRIDALYKEVVVGDQPAVHILPVMGYVGAGAEVEPDFEQVPPEGLEEVEVYTPLPDGLVAFRVRGDSMMPQFRDGATIVVWREQKRPIESFYGAEAVVRTEDGRRFIKTIERGAPGEGVTLASWNRTSIPNQRLAWIGEIYMILPPTFSRRNF